MYFYKWMPQTRSAHSLLIPPGASPLFQLQKPGGSLASLSSPLHATLQHSLWALPSRSFPDGQFTTRHPAPGGTDLLVPMPQGSQWSDLKLQVRSCSWHAFQGPCSPLAACPTCLPATCASGSCWNVPGTRPRQARALADASAGASPRFLQSLHLPSTRVLVPRSSSQRTWLFKVAAARPASSPPINFPRWPSGVGPSTPPKLSSKGFSPACSLLYPQHLMPTGGPQNSPLND